MVLHGTEGAGGTLIIWGKVISGLGNFVSTGSKGGSALWSGGGGSGGGCIVQIMEELQDIREMNRNIDVSGGAAGTGQYSIGRCWRTRNIYNWNNCKWKVSKSKFRLKA